VYLLDTNIVSLFDPRRRQRAGLLIDWMRRNDGSLRVSAVTLLEIETGLLKLRREGKGKRAAEIEALRDGLMADFAERLLSMDAAVALAAARLVEAARPAVIEWKDLVIAATAKTHGATILTRNLRHFAVTGVPALDPLTELPGDAER
jgi:predicted nucleic acid-binding protein